MVSLAAISPSTAQTRWAALVVAILALLWLNACTESDLPELPRLAARLDQTSTSGISSGAYMAGQFHLAHNRHVIGAAIIAGGPYGCAESAFAGLVPGPGAAMLNLNKAMSGCMLDGMRFMGIPDAEWLAEKARRRAERGEIDPTDLSRQDHIYLYTGEKDRIVASRIVRRTADFYRALGIPDANISLIENRLAGHAFVTESEGLACGSNRSPFVTDCDYDQAGALLKQIYGPLGTPSPSPAGHYLHFDQRPHLAGLSPTGLADTGIVYIPSTCEATPGCRIHIAFHGCAQNEIMVGDAFYAKAGFDRWADTNRLIVLFPQTRSTPTNPQGCWDWWGYTGPDFLTRTAPQIRAVEAMIARLGEPASGS
ncbi:MAG: poly(3-hydroxybutyrate) depolymerase [Hyphomicrobiaceae bacterium]